jgi:hypothetical protein
MYDTKWIQSVISAHTLWIDRNSENTRLAQLRVILISTLMDVGSHFHISAALPPVSNHGVNSIGDWMGAQSCLGFFENRNTIHSGPESNPASSSQAVLLL